jgi:hypothetical protein
MQCACVILDCHLWSVRLYNIFPCYLINGRIFGGGRGKLWTTKCVFWFSPQLLSEAFLIVRRTEQDVIINVWRSSCKVTANSSRILMKLEFSRQIFEKILKYHISWKYVRCGPSCSVRTARQTDMTRLIIAFRNFENAHKTTKDDTQGPALHSLTCRWSQKVN